MSHHVVPDADLSSETLHHDITDRKFRQKLKEKLKGKSVRFLPAPLASMKPDKHTPMTFKEYLEKYVIRFPHEHEELKSLYTEWDKWQTDVCGQKKYWVPSFLAGCLCAFILIIILMIFEYVGMVSSNLVGKMLGEVVNLLGTGKDYEQSYDEKVKEGENPLTPSQVLDKLIHSVVVKMALVAQSNPIQFIGQYVSIHFIRWIVLKASGFIAVLVYMWLTGTLFKRWVYQCYIGAYAFVIDRCRSESKIITLTAANIRGVARTIERLKLFQAFTPQLVRREMGTHNLRSGEIEFVKSEDYEIHPISFRDREGHSSFESPSK